MCHDNEYKYDYLHTTRTKTARCLLQEVLAAAEAKEAIMIIITIIIMERQGVAVATVVSEVRSLLKKVHLGYRLQMSDALLYLVYHDYEYHY